MMVLHQSRRILYSVCQTFAGDNVDDMKDLYQDIVFNLWRGWKHFRNKSAVTTWVYRIALNTAMDLRKRRRRREIIIPMSETVANALAEESADERIQYLYKLIDRLREEEKKLIFLYLDHMTVDQMSAIMGIRPQVVKKRLYRIKQKIKSYDEEITKK